MTLIIFDCDGTLVDSQGSICAAMEHAFTSLRLAVPARADILRIVGLSLPQAFAALAPQLDCPEMDLSPAPVGPSTGTDGDPGAGAAPGEGESELGPSPDPG